MVVVARRGEQQIVARLLVELRRIERRIENRPADLAAQGVQGAELLLGDGLDGVEQVAFGEFGHELVVRIVVVDAVGEPYLFEVLLQRLPLGRRAVALIVLVNRLQRAAHRKVHRAILVEQDVTAAFGSLGKVIDQLLLFERQLFETGNFVTDDLDVVETVDDPRRLAFRAVARGQCGNNKCHGCKDKKPFHNITGLVSSKTMQIGPRKPHHNSRSQIFQILRKPIGALLSPCDCRRIGPAPYSATFGKPMYSVVPDRPGRRRFSGKNSCS